MTFIIVRRHKTASRRDWMPVPMDPIETRELANQELAANWTGRSGPFEFAVAEVHVDLPVD